MFSSATWVLHTPWHKYLVVELPIKGTSRKEGDNEGRRTKTDMKKTEELGGQVFITVMGVGKNWRQEKERWVYRKGSRNPGKPCHHAAREEQKQKNPSSSLRSFRSVIIYHRRSADLTKRRPIAPWCHHLLPSVQRKNASSKANKGFSDRV